MKKLLLFYSIVLFSGLVAAQVPTITSFTPTSGVVGTTVIITGNNFSATVANNTVYFGATKATVTAATATQLTVTVPAGATYNSISVAAGGLTALSSSPFTPTFTTNGENINTRYANETVLPQPGSNPNDIASADIDGDGKPELLVVAAGANKLSVYRNISTSAQPSSTTFASKVDFNTGAGVTNLAVGDLDGDGKLDVVATNISANTISVYRNTALLGAINNGSLTAMTDLITGVSPYAAIIADIDGDGKLDIATPNYADNTISVFRNTSSAGSISFATRVNFASGVSHGGFALTDFDGDGKPDMAVANRDAAAKSFSLIRNTSTPGTISYSAKVDIITGVNSWWLRAGDIDGDGKTDLIITNFAQNTFYLYRNTSVTGTISFPLTPDASYDFGAGRSQSGIELADLNGDGKLDFALGDYNSNSILVYWNSSTSGTLSTATFATKSVFGVTAMQGAITASDVTGDGKPELISTAFTNGTISILGQVPTITNFTPTSGIIGSTVTINGAGFDPTAANNTVYFGATKATVTAATATQLTVTVPVGASYQPITVITNGLTATSASPFSVTFATNGVFNASSFSAKVDFATGAGPVGFCVADFDGDGKADIAGTNGGTGANSVSIFKNTSSIGTLTANSLNPKVDYTVGTTPVYMAVGDIDGDGKPDIAVPNYGSNTVSVLLNTSTLGSISFATKVDTTPTGINPWGIALGDIDGDGKLDLAVTNLGETSVSVFRNTSAKGSVSFSAKVDFTGFTSLNFIALQDLNTDGKPEMVVLNNETGGFTVLNNTAISGSISQSSFGFKTTFNSGTAGALLIGDIDLDGKPDVIAGGIFRNTTSTGTINTGSFASVVNISGVDAPSSNKVYISSITDFDGDGKVDLGLTNQILSTFSVLKNNNSVGSINSSSFANAVSFATIGAGDSRIGDIDGDGKPDAIIINNIASNTNTISILRNQLSTLPPAISSFAPLSGPVGTIVTINGTNFNAVAANNAVYFGAVKANVTAASATQLTVTVPVGATFQPISVLANGLAGTSSKPFSVTFASNGVINTSSFATKVDIATSGQLYGVSLGDLDGDGKSDLAVSNFSGATVSVLRNNTTINTITSSSFTNADLVSGSGPYGVAIGDLDLDGKLDVAAVNWNANTVSLYRNKSTSGSLTAASFTTKADLTLPVGAKPAALAIGDLDGDGKPDLVVANSGSGVKSVSVFRNISNTGTLDATSFAAKSDFTTGAGPNWIALGDIDSDGKLDIVTTNGNAASISILRNTSAGSISFATTVDVATNATGPDGVAIGDFDGDGKLDLAVANNGTNKVTVFRNLSTAGTINIGSSAKTDFNVGGQPQSIALGDLDGDGKLEIVVTNGDVTSVSVLQNKSTTGSMAFNSNVDVPVGGNPISVSIGDLDNDGKPDLAVAISNGVLSILRNALKSPQTISSSTLAAKTFGDATFTLAATASSGLAVTYTSSNTAVATISGTTVTIIGAGTTTITASQAGNANFAAAADVPQTLTVNKATQTITFTALAAKNVGDAAFTLSATASSGLAVTFTSGTATVATISGNTVTIVGAGTTTIKASQAGNANYNAATDVSQVLTVNVVDTTPPVVSNNTTPASVAINTSVSVSVTFTDEQSGIKSPAKLLYRPVAGALPNNYISIDMTSPPAGSIYTATIPAAAVTELGVDYKFLVTNGAGLDNSTSQTVFRTTVIQPSGTAVTSYPSSAAGSEQSNYRIIAIPFAIQGNTANDIFSASLGNYDKANWRILTYNVAKSPAWDELNGASVLKQGQGYWFITKISTALTLGTGTTTASASADGGFPITLNTGWNQIGNPYNFNISWADILAANPTQKASLGGNNSKIRVFRGGSDLGQTDTRLKSFEGGFINFTGTSGTTIYIPSAKNASAQGGRIAAVDSKLFNSLDNAAWRVMLSLKNGDATNTLGGLGMSPEAKEGVDYNDDFNAPHFLDYLELKFAKSFAGMAFTKDVVAPAENYVWNFSVESNLKESNTSLTWDNSYFGKGKEIYLVDLATYRTIDMAKESSYSFDKSQSKTFKVVFGSKDFVKAELIPSSIILNEPFPNPTTDKVAIDFALPTDAGNLSGSIKILNMQGEVVVSIATPSQPGSHQFVWDTAQYSPGLYLISLQIGNQTVTKKIIKE